MHELKNKVALYLQPCLPLALVAALSAAHLQPSAEDDSLQMMVYRCSSTPGSRIIHATVSLWSTFVQPFELVSLC
ncbi:unnamed protein product [Amaranthus hypochondriacus]